MKHDRVYHPILRPRRGEFTALAHLPAEKSERIVPIVELEPDGVVLPLSASFGHACGRWPSTSERCPGRPPGRRCSRSA
ncbi:beta family protein [Actinoplanes philippinensis]|uniref:beta family protein n=1 Tax=Actinoplanes philippinensis TaxID=35752 RepID=UPI0033EFAA14